MCWVKRGMCSRSVGNRLRCAAPPSTPKSIDAQVRLPLPQDAGDALLEYLNRARPCVDEDRIFLRSSAPYRPFKGSSVVSSVVRLALSRAGITDAPSKSAN